MATIQTHRKPQRTPLYQRIAQTLRDEIGREYAPDDSLPSQRDLAKRFGTSYATMTNALQELVREGLVKRTVGSGTRVCDTSNACRGLVGVLTSIHDPVYLSTLFASAEAELRRHRYRPVLFGGSTDFDEEKQAFDQMGRLNEVGLIMYSVFHQQFGPQITELRSRGIPGVAVLRPVEGFDFVRVDQRMTGMLQAQHVVRQGYRHILYIGFRGGEFGCLQAEGFAAGLADAGVDKSCVLTKFIQTEDVGDVADRNIRQGIAGIVEEALRKARPEVIVTYSDRYFAEAIEAMLRQGLTPGRDIAFVGADNINLQGFPYASTDHRLGQVGRDAVRMLLERITGQYDGPPRTHTILPQLVIHDGANIKPVFGIPLA